jgi:hypothetical protein
VLLDRERNIKLCDFGLASRWKAGFTMTTGAIIVICGMEGAIFVLHGFTMTTGAIIVICGMEGALSVPTWCFNRCGVRCMAVWRCGVGCRMAVWRYLL